ncbi:MAG: GNAT family N-acetyltransferase [Micrococcales bacterium]|nr:GNAT family N-acetyltransferase [Micrococcales bacterium]
MPTRIVVRAFDQDLVRRSSFTCGRPELDRWLRARAEAPGTRLAVEAATDRVVGYVAAGRYRLVMADGPRVGATLVRFAVAQDYHARGVGRLLLLDALRRLDRTVRAEARLVVVHAFDEATAGFYGRYGFRRLPEHRLTLYLTDRRLRGTVARLGAPARPTGRGPRGEP